MAKREILDPALLRQLLEYNPETGVLTWRVRHPEILAAITARSSASYCDFWNKWHAGKVAMTSRLGNGYLTGSILGKTHSAHRVAWAVHHGVWPLMIDHINGDRADNRLKNLREVDNSANQRNAARQSNNKSGVSGVFWSKRLKKWRAAMQINGKYTELGQFADLSDAIAARRRAELDAGGFTDRHGR